VGEFLLCGFITGELYSIVGLYSKLFQAAIRLKKNLRTSIAAQAAAAVTA